MQSDTRSQTRWVLTLALLLTLHTAHGSPGTLPIYVEENHAGSFAWIARFIDLEEPHTLLLIDAHSDASAADHSDELREKLRRVPTREERERRIDEWRKEGRVQAYNWIEPLMPRPIEQVRWVARPELTPITKRRFQAEAWLAIDGKLDIEARQAGPLAKRWQILDLTKFLTSPIIDGPVIASIDLDFFAGMPNAEELLHRTWVRILKEPQLKGITVAISRPWLRDDEEAYALLGLVLNEIRLTRGAVLQLEPFAPSGRDSSKKAAEFAAKGEPIPEWNIADSPSNIRQQLLMSQLATPTYEQDRWNRLIQEWKDAPHWKISVPVSLDGIFRVERDHLPTLRIQGTPAARVRWWALRPADKAYNLLPNFKAGKNFAPVAVPWVREERHLLATTTDGALDPALLQAELDPALKCGRIRIECEIETNAGWVPTPAVELRVGVGQGFHRGLSEQFGLPYVFGIGFAENGELDGPDLGWGNDCANFLVSAWRSIGVDLPWFNPAQLRVRLEPIAERATVETETPILPEEIARGIAIDLSYHMAALWKDVAPLGVLDANDEVAHHLGNVPEITTLGKLCGTRSFSVLRLPQEVACKALFLGDVVLTGVTQNEVQQFGKSLPSANLVVANLEGIPATAGAVSKRYNFSFPPENLSWLREIGIHAVSLANNHAGDAGTAAIPSALELLNSFELKSFGAGANQEAAINPWIYETQGLQFAFFGISIFQETSAAETTPGVATFPAHFQAIAKEMKAAKEENKTVIVFVHWGHEYSTALQPEQAQWGRWLINHGADAVVGAHPHVVQPLQFWRGKLVAFSLGNAIYPADLKGADNTAFLELSFTKSGKLLRVELH